METVRLGASDLTSSRLAYGCWRICGSGDSPEVTPDRLAHAHQAIIAAYEAGYTLFDHADVYANGESERVFGQVLKKVSGMRAQILVASKCGIRRPGDPDPEAPYRYDFSAGHIIWSCEQSLRRLETDTIDLYQLHRPDYLSNPEEVAHAFSRLKQSGKVREFGVSNFHPNQIAALQKACPMPLIVNQVEISLAKLDCLQDGTIEHCMANKMTPTAWSPLAAGRLSTNDPIDLRDPDHARRIHVRETLDLIARARNTTRPVIALSWLLKHPAKIIPIIGSADPNRIRELARAVDIEISREEWYRLLEASLGARLP